MKNLPWKGHSRGQVTRFRILHLISSEQLRLETSDFVYGLGVWSISLVMTGCQGHLSNFYILDLENFATASRRCTGVINVDRQLVDYTYDGRECRGWMHKLVDCNPLTPLLQFVLDLSYKLYLHCYASVDKNLTDTSRRAVCLQ